MELSAEEQQMYEELLSEAPSFSMQAPVVPPSPVAEIAQAMPPSLMEQAGEVVRDWAPMTGEIAGSIAGSLQGASRGWNVGKVPGAVVGGVAGAILGRGLGETAADLAGDDVDVLDTLSNMAEAGAWEAGGAGVFAVLGKGYRAIRNYRAGKEMTEEEIKSIAELQKFMQSQGTTLTPSQITQSGWQQTLDKVSLAGFGGESQMTSLYLSQNEALKKAFEQEVKIVGKTDRVAAGKAFQDAIGQVEDELIAWAKPQYAAIDKIAKKTPMSFQSMEQWIRGKLLSSGSNLRPNKFKTASIDDLMTMQTRLRPEMEKELKTLLRNSRTISFANGFDDIKRISGELRKLKANKTQPDKELEQFYSSLLDRYHVMMDKQAKAAGTQVYEQYKKVSDVYRDSLEVLRSKSMMSLIDKAPEKIGEEVWANGNVTSVAEAYRAIEQAAKTAKKVGGKPVDVADLKSRFKAGYLDNLFRQVQSEMTDSATTKASTIFGKIAGDPKTRDTFNAVLSKKEQDRIKYVLKWAETLEKQGAGNFSLVVRGRQSAGLKQALNTLSATTTASGLIDPIGFAVGGALAVSPALLARWATSGKASQKAMKQMQGLVAKKVAGNWDPVRDGGAWLSLIASMPLREDDIDPSMLQEGLDAQNSLEYELLKAEAPEWQLLPPSREAR